METIRPVWAKLKMIKERSASNLTSGRLLASNTIWNLLGQLLPAAIGIATIPPLIRGIGISRFGILSLAWIVIGYFSLFDLGIGRALTKLVADKLGADDQDSIPALAWTSLVLMFLLGVLGGLVTFLMAPWLVHKALNVPQDLEIETLRSFYLLAFSIPLVTVTSGLRGILEALQRFRVLNLIRVPMSAFSFLGPFLALPFSHSLVPVIAVLVVGRLVGLVAHLLACLHAIPTLRRHLALDRSIVLPLVKFGGWMTVSNIISPFLAYFDRFLVASLLSVSAIAYYTAPFDIVTRLWIIPGALVGVLFPAFTISLVQDRARTETLLERGSKYIFLAIFPIILIAITLAPEGLRLWLGPVFSQNGASVMRWLAAGVLVNSLAQVPFALIHSLGRPDITAKLHLLEAPVYLLALWMLTKRLGVEGTAIAWLGRNMVDAVLVCLFAHRLFPNPKLLLRMTVTTVAGLALLFLGTLPGETRTKIEFLVLALAGFGLASWFFALVPTERAFVLRAKSSTLNY